MKKPIWKRIWARKYAPFLASAFILSYLKNKKFGTGPNKMFVPEGNLMAYYFEEYEFANLVKNYEKFLRTQNLEKYAKEYEQEFKDFLIYASKMAKIDPSAENKEELSKIVQVFNDRLIQSSDYQFYAFLVLEGPAANLQKRLGGTPEGEKLLQIITTPYKQTKINKAHIELLKLALKKSLKAIDRYTVKYEWLPVYEPLDKPWTKRDFLNQLRNIKDPQKQINQTIKHNRENLLAYRSYIKTIKDKNFLKQVEIVHRFSYLKEMRDDYRRQAYFLLRPFFMKLADIIGLSFREINYLSIPEVAKSVANEKSIVSKIELLARQQAYAFVLTNGKLKKISASKAVELGKKMLPKSGKEIKGMVASPGLVKGRVSIIYHQGEFRKFKDGNILVTTMTHPEFLPIMKKSIAIVTNEGGITCHAAIVSRELKIPCIIGTKNATQALKDGDMVEVDANKGIVRKI